uniref:ZP domain-containing protein n=1 Tax=Romanomermis culicivorax TaxID=13658 RepID=A0A915HK36_ROMCU
MFFPLFFIFVLAYQNFFRPISAVPIDNGVEGDPEIECGASSININFNTKNNFEGHVYVKGHYGEQGCRSDDGGRRVAGINIPFASCGTERVRSLNPKGVYVKQYVIITFHPQFLTKVDRAYAIQCFYMEADKTVSQDLEVSDITTLFQSQVAQMPNCRYEILDSGPTGQPVKYAIIGQQVYHKWTCDTDTTDMFCMLVHTCQVDDGAGNKATLLNEQGCGLDKHLLQHLEYTTDLMAGRESHVFKFADKAGLLFTCQITVSLKEPGTQCPRPQCPDLGSSVGVPLSPAAGGGAASVSNNAASSSNGQQQSSAAKSYKPLDAAAPAPIAAKKSPAAAATSSPLKPAAPVQPPPPAPAAPGSGLKLRDIKLAPRRRFYRQAFSDPMENDVAAKTSAMDQILGVVDVQAQTITALDIDASDDQNGDVPPLSRRLYPHSGHARRDADARRQGVCMSPSNLTILVSLTLTSVMATAAVFFVIFYRRWKVGTKKA